MDTAVTLDFGDGRYRFWLPMARIVEIEKNCGNKSIVAIYEELTAGVGLERDTGSPRFFGAGHARIRDVYEVIRCAAIGGGEAEIAGATVKISPNDAAALVTNYVDGRPMSETVPVAWAILHAAVMGVDLKKKAEPAPVRRSRTAKVKS